MARRALSPLALLLCLMPGVAPAQTSAAAPAVTRGAASITEADVRRRIFLIAADSMGGRDTPSPGLDKTAAYIAAEFRRFGLKPGGDAGGYIQRYPIRRTRTDTAGSSLLVTGPAGERFTLGFSRDAARWRGPAVSGSWPLVLVGGPLDSLHPAPGEYRGKAVVWYPDLSQGAGGMFRAARFLGRGGAALILVSVEPDSLMGTYLQQQLRPQTVVGSGGGTPWVAYNQAAISAQSEDAAQAAAAFRIAPQYLTQALDGWTAALDLREDVLAEQTGPNTVGILEGSDPELRNEYVVFSAHMDHVGTAGQPGAGCRAAGADSVCNGADDDASGTVGILELAEAFSRPGARPKRSMIFLTVSGEEHGLWGSDWFAGHPPVPLDRIVADLNADMIGRNWKDSIVVIGKEHSDLGRTLATVNAAHPDLGMTAIDDRWPEQSFYTRSDHFNFARRGVPVLFFFNGTHPDYHRPSDEPEKIDTEKMTRIISLMYWLGQEVGNRATRPQWNPESYARYVTERPVTP